MPFKVANFDASSFEVTQDIAMEAVSHYNLDYHVLVQ